MELWIRSQDKESLLIVGRIDYELASGTNRIWVNGYNRLVGIYKSKKRALEVLDEIQKLIKPTILTTEYQCEIAEQSKLKFDLMMNPVKTEIKELSTIIYEMPEE